MKQRILYGFVAAAWCVGMCSCGEQKAAMVTTASGLQYQDIVGGTGPSPQKGQIVTVHYTGTLADGKKFDGSRDSGQPLSTPIGIGRVIKGWDEGILTMKVGGRRKFTIPPSLGYGAEGYPGFIPPNAILTFDIELIAIK